jgi:uncharacterized protein
MRFRVSQELKQPVGSESTLELSQHALFLDDDVDLVDLTGQVKLLRTDRGLLVTVRAKARMRGACSRCLASVESPVELRLQEEFIPVIDPVSSEHIKPAEAEEGFVIGPDLVLDLAEPLRQYAMMSAPSKPLCRPDCAGLCPRCGANLNDGPCACAPESDERWRALAALTKEKEGS